MYMISIVLFVFLLSVTEQRHFQLLTVIRFDFLCRLAVSVLHDLQY